MKKIKKNKNGYLKNYKDWNKKIAKKIAKKEGIKMTIKHWEIIYLIKKFYKKYNIVPSLRMILKIKKKKKNKKYNSIYLFKLFPKGPSKQGSKIAGLPKPTKCL
ncbi:TusE/DsrC/DsvC family sulfur relay protein [Buchnera aphidicola]|uniref:TusE/DsrC/DsvC family sulfur relay protein n=1 Tax=Buchnera aphidicola TaxID=9 RepID=UPI0031B8ABCD